MAIVWTVPRAIGSTLLVAPLIKEFLVEGDGTLDAKLTAVGTVSASLEKQVGRTFTSISAASAAIFSGAAGSTSVPDALRLAVMRTLSTEVVVRKPAPQPFSEKVGKRLGQYVFALRDPRNDQVFHVGHGTGNQVFAPVFEALGELANLEGADAPAESNAAVTAAKIARIREIYDAGSAVEHFVLLRSVSAATDSAATTDEVVRGIVEALRITDAGEGLTNLAGDTSDKDARATRVEELALRYSADPAPELPDAEHRPPRTGLRPSGSNAGRDLRTRARRVVCRCGRSCRDRNPRSGVCRQHHSWCLPCSVMGGVHPQCRRKPTVAVQRNRRRRACCQVRRNRGHPAQRRTEEVARQRLGHEVDYRPSRCGHAGTS